MDTIKTIFWYVFIISAMFALPYLIFDGIDRIQAQREASLAQQIDSCRVGNFCKLNGQGFLKTRGNR
jgi:hypothetical protein